MSRKGALPSKPPRWEHAHAASSLTAMPPHAQPPPPLDTSALPIAPSRSYPGSLPSPEQSSSASSLSLSNSDVSLGLVKLNVGGKRYYTTLSTLKGEQLPPNSTGPGFVRDNMLVRLVENDLQKTVSSLRDAKGHIFIDRGPRLFKFVLEFLQTGRVSCSPYHGITKAAVMEELSYYQVIPAACLPDSSSRPQMGPRRIRRVVSVGFRADAQQSGGATEEEDHGAAPLMTASGSEQSHPVSPPLSPHSRSPPRGMTTPAHSRALSPPRLELHPQPPEVEESSQGEQDNFDSTTLAGVMESVHDRLQDWHDMAREFFDLNSVSIARKIDQAAAYGSSSVQVLSWSRCRTTANSRDFSHTDTGTDFQNLRSVPCALFLQHLALIIEEEIGFRTRTWTQPYNSKSCRITVHFPILRRSTPPNPGQQELRIAEAIDAFLDLLRSGDYGSRLAVKQEHE